MSTKLFSDIKDEIKFFKSQLKKPASNYEIPKYIDPNFTLGEIIDKLENDEDIFIADMKQPLEKVFDPEGFIFNEELLQSVPHLKLALKFSEQHSQLTPYEKSLAYHIEEGSLPTLPINLRELKDIIDVQLTKMALGNSIYRFNDDLNKLIKLTFTEIFYHDDFSKSPIIVQLDTESLNLLLRCIPFITFKTLKDILDCFDAQNLSKFDRYCIATCVATSCREYFPISSTSLEIGKNFWMLITNDDAFRSLMVFMKLSDLLNILMYLKMLNNEESEEFLNHLHEAKKTDLMYKANFDHLGRVIEDVKDFLI